MTKINELTIDGVKTSSFKCDVLVETRPTVIVSNSKTDLLEHDGISGAVVQSNRHRGLIEKPYHISLIDPSDEEIYRFSALLNREKFWLENEQEPTIRLWCYKVDSFEIEKDDFGAWVVDVTFICHPTKFFKTTDTQTLTGNGVLRVQGSALAFPKITVVGQSASETSFTIGSQVIKLEKLSESLVMTNNPDNPSFKTIGGKLVKWGGDFITVDASSGNPVGVVLGSGIQSLKFETVWGWA
ncbi:phage tail protein [Streptococcus pluranimalium]|uniref:phage tail protein n=1 Tax=Streptococcus pluranimalium TaxID=82348 RepID=UPI002A77B8D7|nr:phage tail protein [Streptococcus pluranimalium]HEM6116522.1 phage tail protein [Streptococcus suis]